MAKNLTTTSLGGDGTTFKVPEWATLPAINANTFGQVKNPASVQPTSTQDLIKQATQASQNAVQNANNSIRPTVSDVTGYPTLTSAVVNNTFNPYTGSAGSTQGGSAFGGNDGGNSSGGNGAGGATGDAGGTDYTALLNALYAQQQQNAQTLNAQQQQNALDAYNRNMAAMNDAYNTRLGLLGDSFESAMGLLDSNYVQSQARQQQSAEDALRQAYVNRMMNEKNLTQQLVANGISGGASESARAGLINAYGNSRNSIQRSLMDNLANLGAQYINNAQNARQAYNNALASSASELAGYQAQFSSDLANGNASSYSNLFNQMANLDDTYLNRMGTLMANNQTFAQEQALASAQAEAQAKAQQQAIANDWRVGYAQALLNTGKSTAEIYEDLENLGVSDEDKLTIFNAAGIAK